MSKKSLATRTTIILDERDREMMEQLIKDGKEPGIKPFISKMFDIYRTFAMPDWNFPAGEYYSGVSRVAFFAQENLGVLFDSIPKEKFDETGRKLGEATAIAVEAGHNLNPRRKENWPKVLERLRIFGYGDLLLRENLIVVKNPFITNLNVLEGFLEGVLGCTLEPRITTSPMVFEVSK